MSTDDPRIKRVLKRYPKGREFSDSFVELAGISLEELQLMCRCLVDDFKIPRELDGQSLGCFAGRLGLDFDEGKYDYFVHSYVRREFCLPDRVPPKELRLPCEDGPPMKIPVPEGKHWVSARPKNGRENYVGIADEDNRLNA
jgi:hypothetical protein